MNGTGSGDQPPGKKSHPPAQRTIIAPLPGRPPAGDGAGAANPVPGGGGSGGGIWGAAPTPPPAGSGFGSGSGAGSGSGSPFGARPLPGGGAGAAPPQGHPAPSPYPAPAGPGGGTDMWGNPLPAGPARSGPSASGAAQHAWMGSTASDQFFPELARPDAAQARPVEVPRISLDRALSGTRAGHAGASNPLTATAAGLLILFGRLRSQIVEMQALPLMTHVAHELDSFERRAVEAGADAQEALVAKYVLSGTADDIVQNLPGTDREMWVQYSMEARFFNRRTSGVGIFEEIDKALLDAHRRYALLELMLTCLSLGFEGRFRGAPGGDVDLQQKRRQIYETLRHVRGRADDDISPHWQGIQATPLYQRRRVPVWVVACLVLALLTGGYLGMRLYLADVSGQLSDQMRALHPRDTLALLHVTTLPDLPDLPAEPEPYEPPVFDVPGQLERIREALADEIAAGTLSADTRGNFIAVTANNIVLFASGSADARDDFRPIAERIAAMLNAESGAVQIVGHTDSDRLSARNRFRSNQELSVARAQSVAAMITPLLDDSERVEVIGRGEDDPVAGNDTNEGKAMNRRVEILIRREES